MTERLGRRRFLGLFSALSCATIAGEFRVAAASDCNDFILAERRLRLVPPCGWTGYPYDGIIEATTQDQKWLESGSEQLIDEDGKPVYSFTLEPEPVPHFNPAIAIYADDTDAPESISELCRFTVDSFRKMVIGDSLIRSATPVSLNGIPASTEIFRFTFETHSGLRERLIQSHTVFRHESAIYLIMMCSRLDCGIMAPQEEFLTSIRSL